MRAREFLLEYNRQVTAQQVGNRVVSALANDTSADLGPDLNSYRERIKGLKNLPPERLSASIRPERLTDMMNHILQNIEARDPTSNKAYTPWLAKMYAKSGGGVRLEDLNRGDLIRLYDIAKKRRMIKPEHADINRFKWYTDFEDTMENEYNNLDDVEQGKEQEQGSAQKVYEDPDMTIIVPEDKAAACRYGRGTRWCTAATRGENYFDNYNKRGKLYIILPKSPMHDGEKYQLHFETGSYMNEMDEPISLNWLIRKRFPHADFREFLLKTHPKLIETVPFTSDKKLSHILEHIDFAVENYGLKHIMTDWQERDVPYHNYIKSKYGENVNWNEVIDNKDYWYAFNKDAFEFKKYVKKLLDISTQQFREYLDEAIYEERLEPTMFVEEIPTVLAEILDNEGIASIMNDSDKPQRVSEAFNELIRFLNYKVRVEPDTGSVEVTKTKYSYY